MTMTAETISARSLEELRKDGRRIELIDVRTPAEFGEVHVDYARNVPLDRLNPKEFMECRGCGCEEPLYVVCLSGKRGQMACQKFMDAGYTNVINVEGGTRACVDAGLPVIRGKKALSLERQVRMIAGALIAVGVVLGWTVNPWLSGISLACGLGLFHAGYTDSRLMGMMLSVMPWNQASGEGKTCAA